MQLAVAHWAGREALDVYKIRCIFILSHHIIIIIISFISFLSVFFFLLSFAHCEWIHTNNILQLMEHSYS